MIRRYTPWPFLVLCSCGDSAVGPPERAVQEPPSGLPDDPAEYTIFTFDGFAGDQQVRLQWDAEIFDDWPAPPPPALVEVRVWMSVIGPSEGFWLQEAGIPPGPGSTVVSGVRNGTPHFFRITAHDGGGGVVAMSRPVWIEPGVGVSATTSIAAPQIGSGRGVLPYYRNLDWAADGETLAFVKVDDDGASNIYLLRTTDLSVTRFTGFGTEGNVGDPVWSPSSGQLAFTRRDPRTGFWGYRIWVRSQADGITRSVSSGDVDFAPCWLSEDRILFCKGQAYPPNIPELNEMSLDGVETALTTDFTIYKYSPALSPIAPIVMYTGWVGGEGGGILARSLYRFELATRRSVRLTENEHWEDVTPSWSPDGTKVLFASNRNGHYEIWWLEPGSMRTGQVTRATEPGVEHFNPGLSPDGSQLASFRSHGRETWLELYPAPAIP